MAEYKVRPETEKDYATVENVTREAFWNVYKPGCNEHYFVHMMRSHRDFIPELAFVLERDGEIIGNVMYAKSRLIAEDGEDRTILSMGPICILPQYKRQGGSKMLLPYSFEKAIELGYTAVINFGNPGNYVSRGYVSCKRKNVSMGDDTYPTALLVKELIPGTLDGKKWQFIPSDIDSCCEDTEAVARFDAQFPPKEKMWMPSQEELYIYSHSRVVF